MKKKAELFKITTKTDEFFGKTVVLSTGSTYRRLDIPGEEELIGGGVHFCATCDGAFYRDQDIIVVGGGNSALEEGIFLSGFTKKVKIINRNETFSASETYIEKLETIDNIEPYYNKESIEFLVNDEGKFDGLKVRDKKSGEEEVIKADGVFIFYRLNSKQPTI